MLKSGWEWSKVESPFSQKVTHAKLLQDLYDIVLVFPLRFTLCCQVSCFPLHQKLLFHHPLFLGQSHPHPILGQNPLPLKCLGRAIARKFKTLTTGKNKQREHERDVVYISPSTTLYRSEHPNLVTCVDIRPWLSMCISISITPVCLRTWALIHNVRLGLSEICFVCSVWPWYPMPTSSLLKNIFLSSSRFRKCCFPNVVQSPPKTASATLHHANTRLLRDMGKYYPAYFAAASRMALSPFVFLVHKLHVCEPQFGSWVCDAELFEACFWAALLIL